MNENTEYLDFQDLGFSDSCQNDSRINTSRLRYVRLKDVGSKLADERCKRKVVEIATQLPQGNTLIGRTKYWFVTDEYVELIFDAKSFSLKKAEVADDRGVVHYLNLVEFGSRRGSVLFKFIDGTEEIVHCIQKSYDKMQIESKSTTFSEPLQSNNNQNTIQPPTTYAYMDESQSNVFSERPQNNSQNTIQPPILLIENQAEQESDIHSIVQVNDVNSMQSNNPAVTHWPFLLKTTHFQCIELRYSTLDPSVKLLLTIYQSLGILGGATCKKEVVTAQKHEALSNFLIEWFLAPVCRSVPQNIYLCFKYEPSVQIFTELARISLQALGLKVASDFEAVVVNGSVLVYIRCPSYVHWHILQCKDDIISKLTEHGLIEIYECFVSDVEASLQRSDNTKFSNELIRLKEQMINENIGNLPTENRFKIAVGSNLDEDAMNYDRPKNTIEKNNFTFEQESGNKAPTIGLFNGWKQLSGLGELVVQNAMAESADVIILDPNVNIISAEIIIHDNRKCFYSTPVLWNIRRKTEGQVSFYAEAIGTFNQTENGTLRLDIMKPDSKHPYRLFVTMNYMSELYSGVLYSPIPICNNELKQYKLDIKKTIEDKAAQIEATVSLRPTLGQLTQIFGIEYYDGQEDMLAKLLCNTEMVESLSENNSNSQSRYDLEQMVDMDLAEQSQNLLIDIEKSKKFLAVFKTYAQIQFALSLIEKDYFSFNEKDVLEQLKTCKAGTFAIVFSNQYPGLLACHYKSGGLYPETKYLGYFAKPSSTMLAQNYYYRENGQIFYSQEPTQPSHEGFYQIEDFALLDNIPIHYTVDDWIRACVELKYPL